MADLNLTAIHDIIESYNTKANYDLLTSDNTEKYSAIMVPARDRLVSEGHLDKDLATKMISPNEVTTGSGNFVLLTQREIESYLGLAKDSTDYSQIDSAKLAAVSQLTALDKTITNGAHPLLSANARSLLDKLPIPMADAKTLGEIVGNLQSSDPSVSEKAADDLSKIAMNYPNIVTKDVVKALVKGLTHEDLKTAIACANALSNVFTNPPDANVITLPIVLEAAGAMGIDAGEVTVLFGKWVGSGGDTDKVAADFVKALSKHVDDKNLRVAILAAYGLGQIAAYDPNLITDDMVATLQAGLTNHDSDLSKMCEQSLRATHKGDVSATDHDIGG